MLELVELTKKFKQNIAVKSMNMFIEKGEIIGLLGPNGAGKSTVISMLSSLVEPTSGDVRLYNKSIIKNPQPIRKVLGIVPQEIALYPDLTAEENLRFFGRTYRLKGQKLEQRIDDVLELIGLKEKRKEIVKHFSGGMKRRLNIGAGLLHEPELLVMDEATVGIDPQSRNYILETVKRLNREKRITMIYTSHYMEEIEFLCDRIYIMDHGNLIASGTKEEITQIMSAEKSIDIGADWLNETFINALEHEPTVNKVTVTDKKKLTVLVPREVDFFITILQLAEKNGVNLSSVDTNTPSLEDVFLYLTGRALRD